MFEDIETHKKLSKWIIGTFTACILIYLRFLYKGIIINHNKNRANLH